MQDESKARISIALGAFVVALALAGCASGPERRGSSATADSSVVPAPVRIMGRPGRFVLGPSTRIVILESQVDLLPVASYLKAMLGRPTGYDLAVEVSTELAGESPVRPGSIVLQLDDREAALGGEGYKLEVEPESIRIVGPAPAGVFYGVQTLRQLLPAAIEGAGGAAGDRSWTVPCVSVEDRPRFPWRGALLDCARHFFPKEFVLRWIDILAMHKLNTFHWHLTDDQGWRIEIRKYPRLTEVGAWRVDREDRHWNAREPQRPDEAATYGGFYTQDEIREVVAYAAARHITVVPEIEMPGHAKSALAAYPGLSCTGGPFTVPPGGYWPITDVFCPGKEGTFEFLENVLAEVVELFPGPFVHIGGDEVDKAEWKRCPDCLARMMAEGLADEGELQSYFVRRIEKVLNGKGRRLIGWDEILEGGLAPQATVMSWRGTEGGIAAARAGHDVVMSPTSHCYIDYYQGDPAYEPPAIGGYVPLGKVYAFEPVPEVLTEAEAGHILGGQANLWTEYVPDGKHAEYMALPRLAALAEAVWSPKDRRSWEDFAGRFGTLMSRYASAGLNAARSAYLVAIEAAAEPGAKRAVMTLSTEVPVPDIRYTLDGSDPGPSSKRYKQPLMLVKSAVVKAAVFDGREPMSPAVSSERFLVHSASGIEPALASPFSPKYPGGGGFALTDGLLGTKDAEDGRWQGFEGVDLEAVIDLGRARPVRALTMRSLQNINSWIFLPVEVEFAVSDDGETYVTVAKVANDVSPHDAGTVIKEFAASFEARPARFVRVLARSLGTVPDWHYGAGGQAWLFADEMIVE